MELKGFVLTRSTAALSIKAVTVLGVIIVIYFQDFAIIANEALRNELMSHLLAIPFILLYLIYRKRKMLRAAISFEPSNSFGKHGHTT